MCIVLVLQNLKVNAHFLKLLMISSSEGPVFLLDSLSKDACTCQNIEVHMHHHHVLHRGISHVTTQRLSKTHGMPASTVRTKAT